MSGLWSNESRVRRREGVVWKRFEAELALLDPTSGNLRTLNEVAARCWELADGRRLSEIVDVLLKEFDVDRNILEQDVVELVGKLNDRGLLDQ